MSRVLVHFDIGDATLHSAIVSFLQQHGFVEESESVYSGSLAFGPQMVGLRPEALQTFMDSLETIVRAHPQFGAGDSDVLFVEWASNGTIVPERIRP